MQSLSLAVLEKSSKCLDELKTVAEELRVACGGRPRTVPSATNTPAATTAKTPEKSRSQERSSRSMKDELDDEEEDDEEELDEETQKELLTPMAVKMPILLSLESAREDPFEEQSKRDVMARCEKILSKSVSPDVSAKKLPPPPPPVAPTTKKEPPPPPPPPVPKPVVVVEKKPPQKVKRVRRELLPKPQLPGESIGFKVGGALISEIVRPLQKPQL